MEEWKFARANLWLVYIEHEGVLPPPLNLLPSRIAITKITKRVYEALLSCRSSRRAGCSKLRDHDGNKFLEIRRDSDLKSIKTDTLQMKNQNVMNDRAGMPGYREDLEVSVLVIIDNELKCRLAFKMKY